jgi:cytochrome c5
MPSSHYPRARSGGFDDRQQGSCAAALTTSMGIDRGTALAGFAALAGVVFAIASMQFAPRIHAGKRTYDASCAACHEVGAHGAPRAGDVAAWAPRLARGEESLYGAALHGKASGDRLMPPRGGDPRLSDAEVRAAVDYLVTRSR